MAKTAKNGETPPMTPMMKQYFGVKKDYPDGILMFRMGDFYEVFYDDARACSRILGLTLTARHKKTDNPIPMAGLPHHAAQGYIKRLVDAGQKVIICDQVEDPAAAKGIVKREVTRVITPGTVVEEDMLNARTNNYLATVSIGTFSTGIAYADISTGEYYLEEAENSKAVDVLARIAPAELILSDEADTAPWKLDGRMISRRSKWDFETRTATEKLQALLCVSTLEGFGINGMEEALRAAGALASYISDTQKQQTGQIKRLIPIQNAAFLVIDQATQLNLEITRTQRDRQEAGSLVSVLDKTHTAMGARCLRNWLNKPLLCEETINTRLGAVTELKDNTLLRDGLQSQLREIGDLQRLSAKIACEKANARDLNAIALTCSKVPLLRALLDQVNSDLLQGITKRLTGLDDATHAITSQLLDDPPPTIMEGHLIRPGIDDDLDELKNISQGGKTWIANFQKTEAQRTGINSLKISYNRVFGYYIEITNAHKDKVPEDYIRKQTLSNAERYITAELKDYESKVLGADEKTKKIEYDLFIELRKSLVPFVDAMQSVAMAIAELDTITCLAQVATENNYCRPTIDNSLDVDIFEGRHPVVEDNPNGEKFIPNDTQLASDQRFMILTGPNMSGKSTFIRQSALIILMAQIGSFVPATSARIGIVDRIFTRIGASDELSKGQSTFMVEMVETANILNNATERSFIVLDEVGRGTSTFDGLSIAWAITEYLLQNTKARSLFATHYHELTELSSLFSGIKNCHVSVKEWNDDVVFLHKIADGRADKSYGIHVARLAGVPISVTTRANEILQNLEANEFDVHQQPKLAKKQTDVASAAATTSEKNQAPPLQSCPEEKPQQMLLFADTHNKLAAELKSIDLNNLTPMQALQKLQDLQENY